MRFEGTAVSGQPQREIEAQRLDSADAYRRVVHRLEQADERHELLVDELNHRVRNLVTIAHSIVSQALPGQSDVADKINRRITALVRTNELVVESGNRKATLRDLIVKEFAPYEAARFTLQGISIVVPADLLLLFGLIFHELATNATKYGALASPEGRIAVAWDIAGGNLNIDWMEAGGPPVLPPTRRGFGTTLLESSFRSLEAQVEIDYQPLGFRCKISLPLSAQWSQSGGSASAVQTHTQEGRFPRPIVQRTIT
jgi:two-component sensor histidine kinase